MSILGSHANAALINATRIKSKSETGDAYKGVSYSKKASKKLDHWVLNSILVHNVA